MSDVPPSSRLSVRLTRAVGIWIAVAVVLGFVGWFKSINLLLILGYVLGVLLVLNAWLAWRTVRRVRATRLPTPPVFPGETAAVRVEVTNPSAGPAHALLVDHSAGNRDAWLLAPLRPGETRRLTARWAFATRGRHRIGPLVADASYPFGVVRVTRSVADDGSVLVLPAVGAVDLEMFRRWLIRHGSGDTNTRRPTRRPLFGQGDVRGIRPYRTGDSPRDVHWKTTARRGQLLVREYDQAEPLDLVLLIDPWLPASPGRADVGRLEWALSAATTLGKAWCEVGHVTDVTLVVPGSPPVVETGRGTPAFARRAFVHLAELTGTPDVPAVSPAAIRRRTNRSARVLVSSRSGSPVAAALRAAGMPFNTVDPTDPPKWYTPPANDITQVANGATPYWA